MSNEYDDFITQIQSDELIPHGYEDGWLHPATDEGGDPWDRGLTADERDHRALESAWREQCISDLDDDDTDEFCAVFSPDDEDNFDSEYLEGDGDAEDSDW